MTPLHKEIVEVLAAPEMRAAYGLEAAVQLDGSGAPEYQKFDSLRREQGLAEAIKWRDAQFAPYE